MKQWLGPAAAVVFAACSCSAFEVTKDFEAALARISSDVRYHDRAYMEKTPLEQTLEPVVSSDELKKGGRLNFIFVFSTLVSPAEDADLDRKTLSAGEWAAVKSEFENALSLCGRFTSAGDAGRSGAQTIMNVVFGLTVQDVSEGAEQTEESQFHLACTSMNAADNSADPRFPPFRAIVSSSICRKIDRSGKTTDGFRFTDAGQLKEYHLRMARAGMEMFFAHLCQCFPVFGLVSGMDENGNLQIDAGSADGVVPDMEMVVFARRRSDGDDAILVPLFNATVVELGKSGKSTLRIWRKSDRVSSARITKKMNAGFVEANKDYEFFASASGLPRKPDFLNHQNMEKK